MIRLARAYLHLGLLVVMLFGGGCGTTAAALNACEATALQSQQILDKLGSSKTASVAVAAVDALQFGCATASEIDAFIAAHETDAGAASLAESDPLDAVRLANAKAWRAAHPVESAFTCARFNTFTHLCAQWVPSLIPGSPANYVPAGDPSWCFNNTNSDLLQPGWAEVFNDQPVAGGRYCAMVPPGNYGTLGDFDYTSTIAAIPSVHVRAIVTGRQAYVFTWDGPNFTGNFIGYYGPSGIVSFTSTVRSFELILGQ